MFIQVQMQVDEDTFGLKATREDGREVTWNVKDVSVDRLGRVKFIRWENSDGRTSCLELKSLDDDSKGRKVFRWFFASEQDRLDSSNEAHALKVRTILIARSLNFKLVPAPSKAQLVHTGPSRVFMRWAVGGVVA